MRRSTAIGPLSSGFNLHDPGSGLVAPLVELDPALHRQAAHLLGKDWSACHLGAELGGRKAEGKRKHGPANDEAEAKVHHRQTEPDCGDDQSGGRCRAGFVGNRKITKDTAGEKHR